MKILMISEKINDIYIYTFTVSEKAFVNSVGNPTLIQLRERRKRNDETAGRSLKLETCKSREDNGSWKKEDRKA